MAASRTDLGVKAARLLGLLGAKSISAGDALEDSSFKISLQTGAESGYSVAEWFGNSLGQFCGFCGGKKTEGLFNWFFRSRLFCLKKGSIPVERLVWKSNEGLRGELLLRAWVVAVRDGSEASLTICFSAAFWKNDSREVVAFLVVVTDGPLPWVLASGLVIGTFGSLLKKTVMSVQDEGAEAENLVAQRKSIVRGGDLYGK